MPEVGAELAQLGRRLDPALGRDQEVALRRGRQLGGGPVAVGRRAFLGRRRAAHAILARMRVADLPTPALVVDTLALDAQSRHDDRGAARRPPAPAREGAQVHGARARAGEPRAPRLHRRDAARAARPRPRRAQRRPPARQRVGRRRPAARAGRLRRARHRRGRLRGDGRRRGPQRHPRGAHRRQRRHPALRRAAPTTRAALADLARGSRARPCAARWATKATRCSWPTAPSASTLTDESMAIARRARTRRSAVRSSPAAEPAPTTVNTVATEIQAGSYALMDTAYAKLDIPFELALAVVATVIHANPKWSCRRLRAEGARHGPRQPDRSTTPTSCSAPTSTSRSRRTPRCASATACSCGPRTSIRPSRTTTRCTWPTVRASTPSVIDRWPVDLRGWDEPDSVAGIASSA